MTSFWIMTLALTAFAGDDPPAQAARPAPLDVVAALETALSDAIEKTEASVVAIARDRRENPDETTAIKGRNPLPIRLDARFRSGQDAFLPVVDDFISLDTGSGIVVGDHGEILTTFHVVKGANRLVVRAIGAKQGFDAEILAADPRSDLAVIVPREIPGVPSPALKPIRLGDSSKLRKGSFLIALGNPFNAARDGRPSASWGILSNVSRRIEPSIDERMTRQRQLRHFPTLLQLDAKLNQGMSGGAVVNLKGELVGVTTDGGGTEGFDAAAGYAIPMNPLARRVVETLKQGKEFEYGMLGIGLDVVNGTSRVDNVQPNTPAAMGGVLADDLITQVGDTPVTDADNLVLAVNALPAGTVVKLKIERAGRPVECTVELAKYFSDPASPPIVTNVPPAWRGLRIDYLSTLPNAGFGFERLNVMARGGVAVIDVEPGTPADKAGLKRGQVISRIDDKPIHNPREFREALAKITGAVKLGTDAGDVTIQPK